MPFFCFYFQILTKTWIPEQTTSPSLSQACRLGVISLQTSQPSFPRVGRFNFNIASVLYNPHRAAQSIRHRHRPSQSAARGAQQRAGRNRKDKRPDAFPDSKSLHPQGTLSLIVLH